MTEADESIARTSTIEIPKPASSTELAPKFSARGPTISCPSGIAAKLPSAS